jgi:hypothetical protein
MALVDARGGSTCAWGGDNARGQCVSLGVSLTSEVGGCTGGLRGKTGSLSSGGLGCLRVVGLAGEVGGGGRCGRGDVRSGV